MLTHLRQRFWTATVSARRYGLSASTIHNVCRKKKHTLSHQCGPPLKGQTMTRHHRLVYVQWARRHFIWQCVNWKRVSFSGETRFALSNAGGKTHKQALLGLLRARKGSISWGQFRGLGWKNGWPDYFVIMRDNFNALYRRRLVTLCRTISPLFLHIKWSDIWSKLKQNKNAIECNVFFFVLRFLKGVDILS